MGHCNFFGKLSFGAEKRLHFTAYCFKMATSFMGEGTIQAPQLKVRKTKKQIFPKVVITRCKENIPKNIVYRQTISNHES